jgi:hypothetical protein
MKPFKKRTPVARRGAAHRRTSFARDLTIVLAVKFALLGVLYQAFFAHPVAPHGGMQPGDVARAVLGPSANPSIGTEIHHDR